MNVETVKNKILSLIGTLVERESDTGIYISDGKTMDDLKILVKGASLAYKESGIKFFSAFYMEHGVTISSDEKDDRHAVKIILDKE